jgi:hypothetical protein
MEGPYTAEVDRLNRFCPDVSDQAIVRCRGPIPGRYSEPVPDIALLVPNDTLQSLRP